VVVSVGQNSSSLASAKMAMVVPVLATLCMNGVASRGSFRWCRP
jgi:hypothetical protein